MSRAARPARPTPGLATRLLSAQTLVILTGALTAWLVVLIVGPPIFRNHLQRAEAADPADHMLHAEAAFRSATAIALSVALLAALVTALAAGVYVTHRIGRSVRLVADAAATLAGGNYDAQVPPPRLGPEFDVLASSFNQMASRLQATEVTRRRLLTDLAHEMRTPVATLDAYLEGVQDGVITLDPDNVTMLRSQAQRLARLAEDITAVSRAEEHQLTLNRRPLNPAVLVQDAIEAATGRYTDYGVLLDTKLDDGLPSVEADPDRLAQVLGNLLDNALRHTPPGGIVTVAAAASGRGVEISVVDTGEGIPTEHLAHVFERFYRVDTARDREHGGSGIGLAITKALVEAHGGRIRIDSPGPGRGTTVTFWLPAR